MMRRFLVISVLLILASASGRAQTTPIFRCAFQGSLLCTFSGGSSSLSLQTNASQPGLCAPGVAWNYQLVQAGQNNGGYQDRGYLRQTLCPFDVSGFSTGTWDAGFSFNPPAALDNTWPAVFYKRFRIYFESPPTQDSGAGPGDTIRTMKFMMDHRDVFDGDQRFIGFVEYAGLSGGNNATEVGLAFARNIFTGPGLNPSSGTDVARVRCLVGAWCHVQVAWRHGPVGTSFIKAWVNNNDFANPTAQDLALTAVPTNPGGTAEWPRSEAGYNGQWDIVGHVANDGTQFEDEFTFRFMDYEVDDAFDATWANGAAPPPPPPPPGPVDCVVSAWSAWVPNGTGTETRTRTVVTPPANGGAACPLLTETRTVPQVPDPCVSVPLLFHVRAWPGGNTGNRRFDYYSNATVRIILDLLTNPWRASATDARGCSVTVTR